MDKRSRFIFAVHEEDKFSLLILGYEEVKFNYLNNSQFSFF